MTANIPLVLPLVFKAVCCHISPPTIPLVLLVVLLVVMPKQFDENTRLNRAKDVFIVDALDTKIFSVRGSKGDASYTVDLNKGTCTCPDYVYRCAPLGSSCKHVVACRQKVAMTAGVVA
jgi:hypothetical protein